MTCSKCGTQNVENSKFCIKCGNSLNTNFSQNNFQNLNQQLYNNSDVQPVQPTNSIVDNQSSNTFNNLASSYNESVQQVQNFNYDATVNSAPQSNIITQPINQNSANTNTNLGNDKMSFTAYLFVILAVILKPFTAFKEELNKFNTFKNSLLVSLIVSGAATIITLLKTMYSAVRVSSYSYSGTTKSWVWGNLKEINYIKTIGINLLIYLGIILAIAVVYYLASLIIKKQVSFSKFLGISALSIVPFVVCYLVVAPLLAMIYAPLNMAITIIGTVYTIILVYETINSEISLDGNTKYYFNLICLSILSIAAYYLFVKVFKSSVSNGINDILNQFGF